MKVCGFILPSSYSSFYPASQPASQQQAVPHTQHFRREKSATPERVLTEILVKM